MTTDREEIADLWNRIEQMQKRVESTRTNLTILCIAVLVLGFKVLS